MHKRLMLLTTLLVPCFVNAADMPVVPSSRWRIESTPDARATLEENAGALMINYTALPSRPVQSGNRTYLQSDIDLLLDKPLALDADVERLIYEAYGLTTRGTTEVLLLTIIRDAEGELFYYLPNNFPHLKAGGTKWSCRMSPVFYAGEAGAATHDIYYTGGTLGNSRPDGALQFLGFRLSLRQPSSKRTEEKAKPSKGVAGIGAVATCGVRIAWTPPFVYADNVFSNAGLYRFSAQIRNEFQGIPIREFSREVEFNPTNSASARQKLVFSLGPDNDYWIDYQITDREGRTVDGGSMRSQVLGNPDRTPVAAIDTKCPPPLGCFRINPDHAGRGVYDRAEPMKITLRVFPKGSNGITLNWKLLAYGFNDILDQGTQTLAKADAVFADLAITPRTTSGGDAYRLVVEAIQDGKAIDRQTYYCGFRTPADARHDRAGMMTDRRKLKETVYFRTTYIPLQVKTLPHKVDAVQHFREYLDQSRSLASDVTVMVDLVDFEVLPGVFDFELLDGMMDAAADYGCKITVRFAHTDSYTLYRWLKASRQVNYDGTPIDLRPYGGYAVPDPGLNALWLGAYHALFNRYRQHTAFQGYYIMLPGGEWTVLDQPWEGKIAGYEPVTAAAFRDYMQKKLKLTLADVNQRWGTSYRRFDEIKVPMPTLRDGALPDLRMQWIDFCLFKFNMAGDLWFPTALDSIRSYDDDRVTITYGAPDRSMPLAGKLDYCHNGGNHYGENLGQFAEAWDKGKIGWITEPVHPHRWAADVADGTDRSRVLDWSVWVMLAQAGGGGANLHIYYMPNPTLSLPAHFGGHYAYDKMMKFRPILTELHSMRLLSPPTQVAVIQDPYTLFAKHRTTFHARLLDLKRWFELLKRDHVPCEDFNPAKHADYRLYVPNLIDEVISLDTLEALDRGVREGAKLVISANTGKYVPELGKTPFQLLKRLGIRPPAQAYQTKGMNVAASAVADNPLFASGAEIPFQTGEKLHAHLNSEAIRKVFWGYPYRWIPETDYFGYYPGLKDTGGRALATFADGGVAMSLHRVGKGEVVVFWGTPDMSGHELDGMMGRAADWAGVVNPLKGSPVPYVTEGYSDPLGRYYALLYQNTPGTYTQKVASVTDGNWFLDEMVSDAKLGIYTGAELRSRGLPLEWREGDSPLKMIRIMPESQVQSVWKRQYRMPAVP